MRLVALLLILLASNLAAQAPVRSTPLAERGSAAAQAVSPADAPVATTEPMVDAIAPAVQPDADHATSATPTVLDEGFWRQVLAGVIITVISTLILRVIL